MATLKLAAYTLADARIEFIGLAGSTIISGVSDFDAELTREKANNAGTGKNPVSRSRGSKDGTGSMTMEVASRRSLLNAYPTSNDLTDIPPGVLKITLENDEGDIDVHTFNAFEFTNDGLNVTTGGESAKRSYSFIYV